MRKIIVPKRQNSHSWMSLRMTIISLRVNKSQCCAFEFIVTVPPYRMRVEAVVEVQRQAGFEGAAWALLIVLAIRL